MWVVKGRPTPWSSEGLVAEKPKHKAAGYSRSEGLIAWSNPFIPDGTLLYNFTFYPSPVYSIMGSNKWYSCITNWKIFHLIFSCYELVKKGTITLDCRRVLMEYILSKASATKPLSQEFVHTICSYKKELAYVKHFLKGMIQLFVNFCEHALGWW